ncbi:hypothetical protein SO802_009502 [Lithocarpus litseifolius]|uniref:Uncharacterized protein n=1 Tax=Lithocarpus litseifolius TaxID=425828 RepID=A0AAW2DFE7_9ROSI
MRVKKLMMRSTGSLLNLKMWKPHLLSLRSHHWLSLKVNHTHLHAPNHLDLLLDHLDHLQYLLMSIRSTPHTSSLIFKSKSLLSPLKLKIWRAWTSTFDHSINKGE